MQEVKIIARTFEVEPGVNDSALEMNSDLTLLAGKAAGVCYMPDDYMENGIQNKEKAMARARQTSKSGHHSVYDHGHITLLLKTNKMMAMILNSMGVYATSEKSARYTKMQPETTLELELYEKWKTKIQKSILAKYPGIDDVVLNTRIKKELSINDKDEKVVKDGELLDNNDRLASEILDTNKKSDTLPSAKLAQENARYMISVFTPTTMVYTLSYRQLCKTINYLSDLVDRLYCLKGTGSFSAKLFEYVVELHSKLAVLVEPWALIKDNKNQYIRFLEAQNLCHKVADKYEEYADMGERLRPKEEVVADSYTLVYEGSLAMLAQAQRHRTLRYSMNLVNTGGYGYYVPEIIKDTPLEEEWLRDIKSVEYCVPQGTIVKITEQGLFEDFALKCKERMCARAQLEIMKSTAKSIDKFYKYKDRLSYSNRELLDSMVIHDKENQKCIPCPRCCFTDFKCTERCDWDIKEVINRLI